MILFLFTFLFACQEPKTIVTSDGTEIIMDRSGERPSYCYGKESRSKPSCWTSYDWEVYCSRVQCMRQNTSK